MENLPLPDCPLCENNARVEKVSALVERVFSFIPKEKLTRVVWAGKSYYIKDSFIKRLPTPTGNTWFLFGGPSLERLARNAAKSNLAFQAAMLKSGFGKPEQLDQTDEITAILLLPILENPGSLPAKPSFWHFFLELLIFRGYWFLALLLLLVFGIFQNIWFFSVAGLFFLFLLFLFSAIGAIFCKITVAFLRKMQAEYERKRKNLAVAEDRWNRLYYCAYHAGIFTPQGELSFTYIKDVQKVLFSR